MKNFFALFGLGTIVFFGLGWYLDWYKFARQPGPAGTQRITIDVNGDKVTNDVKKGIERGSEIVDRLGETNNKPETQNGTSVPQTETGPATQFFTPPSSSTQASTNNPWKSLDKEPPPLPR